MAQKWDEVNLSLERLFCKQGAAIEKAVFLAAALLTSLGVSGEHVFQGLKVGNNLVPRH